MFIAMSTRDFKRATLACELGLYYNPKSLDLKRRMLEFIMYDPTLTEEARRLRVNIQGTV